VKRAHRIGAWLGGSLLALLLTCALVVFAFLHIFYPHVRPANYPPTHNLATAQRQDLDYFKQYFTLNRSYTPSARAQAERLFRDTYAKVGALSPAAFSLSILRMVALADNGHSQVYKGSLSSTNNRIPCRLYHFADGYYIIRTRPACAALLGAKLIAVDAQPVDELVDRMFEYSGGPRNHYDQYVSVFFLESPALLHAAGLVAQADQLTLQVQLRDGSLQEVAMHADPPNPDAPDVYSDAYLSPQHIDPTRLSNPKAIGNFVLRGSVRPVFTGGFAHTVAQVSASSKDVESCRAACPGASSGTRSRAAAQVAANSAGVRSSSAECGRWWL